jgi:hypothetical protein
VFESAAVSTQHTCVHSQQPLQQRWTPFFKWGWIRYHATRRVLTLWLGRVIPNFARVNSGSGQTQKVSHLASGQSVSWVRLTPNTFQPHLTGVLFLKNKDSIK